MKKLQCQCVSENIKFLTDYLTCVDSFAAFFIQVQALLLFSDMCEITLVNLAFSVAVAICLFVSGLSLFHLGVYIQSSTARSLQGMFRAAEFRQSMQGTYLSFPWQSSSENMDGLFAPNGQMIRPGERLQLPTSAEDYIVVSPETRTPIAQDRDDSDDSDDSDGWWLQSPNGNHFRQVKARQRQMSPCKA